MALTDAGIAGNAELLDRADMIVAAGGGERDTAVDTAIMAGMRKTNTRGAFLNERLISDCAPLCSGAAAQPPCRQYLAGARRRWILAHVHGRGAAGVDAVRVGRVAAGQSEFTLVGGAYIGTRWTAPGVRARRRRAPG